VCYCALENKGLPMANSKDAHDFSKPRSQLQSTLVSAIRWLTKPASTLNASDSRRSRLLAWLLLFIFLLTIITILLLVIFNPHHDPLRNEYVGFIIALVVFVILAYGLNHTGYYYISAGLTVACAVIGPWGSLMLDPSIRQGNFVPLTYVVIPISLSSILLPPAITIGLAVFQLAALGFMASFSPVANSINWPSFLIFVFFISVLSILSNIISRLDLRLIDQQVQQLALSEKNLRELSIRDHLTNLYNRKYLDETLDREIQRAARKQLPLGVILLDIDHFKCFNDSLGHAAGDTLLKELGKLLAGQVRLSDIACRYGGEEFVLILPEAPLEVTKARAEHLRERVKHLNLEHNNQGLGSITISLGVAVFPDHGVTSEALLKSADTALYRAKNEGRDCVVIAAKDRIIV
jgi:diguanylate cyclase (GGDEF)-like protein